MKTQPEALRLAEIQNREWPNPCPKEREQTAAELRRLHESNQELLAALKAQMLVTTWEDQEAANELARAAINKAERTTT